MSSREVTRFKRDLVNIHESFKSNCGVYAETLADCNNTWCYQEGTARQYTSCSSVSSDGFTWTALMATGETALSTVIDVISSIIISRH